MLYIEAADPDPAVSLSTQARHRAKSLRGLPHCAHRPLNRALQTAATGRSGSPDRACSLHTVRAGERHSARDISPHSGISPRTRTDTPRSQVGSQRAAGNRVAAARSPTVPAHPSIETPGVTAPGSKALAVERLMCASVFIGIQGDDTATVGTVKIR